MTIIITKDMIMLMLLTLNVFVAHAILSIMYKLLIMLTCGGFDNE